jgi:hypothetical protein
MNGRSIQRAFTLFDPQEARRLLEGLVTKTLDVAELRS